MKTKTITIQFTLNGTNENPFLRFGVTQNPFPQIPKFEYLGGCVALNKLGGDPIPRDGAAEYIRQTLKGFSEEFVSRVIQSYRPGEIVRCKVSFPL